jgi:hypothetical protein
MNHPVIDRIEKTGYPYKVWEPKKLVYNACDVCEIFEAEIKFKRTKLCSGCAKEENIEIL